MQLTRHTDYGLRVLVFVALRADLPATIHDVAQYFGISQHHLVKVVQRLAAGGFVVARRGRGGGIALARDAHAINLADVVRHTEPDLGLVECQRARLAAVPNPGAVHARRRPRRSAGPIPRGAGRHSLADVLVPMAPLLAPESLVRGPRRRRTSR